MQNSACSHFQRQRLPGKVMGSIHNATLYYVLKWFCGMMCISLAPVPAHQCLAEFQRSSWKGWKPKGKWGRGQGRLPGDGHVEKLWDLHLPLTSRGFNSKQSPTMTCKSGEVYFGLLICTSICNLNGASYILLIDNRLGSVLLSINFKNLTLNLYYLRIALEPKKKKKLT